MFAERYRMACNYLVSMLKLESPFEWGNLSQSISIVESVSSAYHIEIIIGGGRVEYAPATNEAWESPKWKGKVNPNQGWIERAIEKSLIVMRQLMSGVIQLEEVQALINNNELAYLQSMNRVADEIALREQARRLNR